MNSTKKSKGIKENLILFLIILLCIGIGFGIVWLYDKYRAKRAERTFFDITLGEPFDLEDEAGRYKIYNCLDLSYGGPSLLYNDDTLYIDLCNVWELKDERFYLNPISFSREFEMDYRIVKRLLVDSGDNFKFVVPLLDPKDNTVTAIAVCYKTSEWKPYQELLKYGGVWPRGLEKRKQEEFECALAKVGDEIGRKREESEHAMERVEDEIRSLSAIIERKHNCKMRTWDGEPTFCKKFIHQGEFGETDLYSSGKNDEKFFISKKSCFTRFGNTMVAIYGLVLKQDCDLEICRKVESISFESRRIAANATKIIGYCLVIYNTWDLPDRIKRNTKERLERLQKDAEHRENSRQYQRERDL